MDTDPEKGTGPGPTDRGPDNPHDVAARTNTPFVCEWQRALRDSGLPPSTRHVALALSTYMNSSGGSAHPGAPRLARDTGKSEDRLRKHLSRLVDDGWLVVVERGGVKGEVRRANSYRAVVPELGADDEGDWILCPECGMYGRRPLKCDCGTP